MSQLKSPSRLGSNHHSSKLTKILRGTRTPLGLRKYSSPGKVTDKQLKDSKNESLASISIKTPRIRVQQK